LGDSSGSCGPGGADSRLIRVVGLGYGDDVSLLGDAHVSAA
jgi:hypothetical protein